MKKIILIIAILVCLPGLAQMKVGDSTIVEIKEYAGVKIYGCYKLVREKEDKKEYKCSVWFENVTDNEIFYKKTSFAFATVKLSGLSSYTYDLKVKEATKKLANKKIHIIYPKLKYNDTYYFVKWYDKNESPTFVFEPNKDIVLENDYSRYQ